MMRRMAMLAETELCVPKIVYHSYFDRDPLFNVSIDPEAVAKLCSILGMKNEDIAKKTIVVSPQILPDSTVGATYCTQTQTVTLYRGCGGTGIRN